MSAEADVFDVIVIGAGQAGLAMGYHLARQGKRFVIVEAENSVGSAWRTRWDSLRLFTSRRYDALPGLPFPGDPDGYPTRDETIAYLESYATRFELPIRLNTRVKALTKQHGLFVAETESGEIQARQVVVATGPFQIPRTPPVARGLSSDVFQIHSTGYRKPSDVPEGTVLVVGGGNTGYQIAEELATTRQTHLAVGTTQKPLPQRLLGRDVFWWLSKSRILEVPVDSRLGQRLKSKDTLIGSSPRRLAKQGVQIRPRLVETSDRVARFADGTQLEVHAVIWATGYTLDHSWIHLPITDSTGEVRHRRGVTEVPGLYFLGLPWQQNRASALLGWVKNDADYIASQIKTTPTSEPSLSIRVAG